MKKIVIGILAHVDSGKTTLSEALLYHAGEIRRLGRVDHRDSFLDTNKIERERGITVFSKQATLALGSADATLLDTPGHVDFAAEAERVLDVLDYAVLVVSGTDGVQAHTKTLWQLLERYGVPCFIFVNKTDLAGADRDKAVRELDALSGGRCVVFGAGEENDEFLESISLCDETIMQKYIDGAKITDEDIARAVNERNLFPCYFGSALKDIGVDALIDGLDRYTLMREYPKTLRAKVFKISESADGRRLTHLKVTGGSLAARQTVDESGEKVNEIRIYSGEKYTTVNSAGPGTVCAVTGLTKTYPGQGIGGEADSGESVLEPVFTYSIRLPDGTDAHKALLELKRLEEEETQLNIVWDERLQEIRVRLMGEVQLEILKELIYDRFGMDVEFESGGIIYKETIADTVEGVGHYEPLRHYAEVHLLMESAPRGTGIVLAADCSTDELDLNWQRLILTHLAEKTYTGVLTGSPITDIRITLKSGRAHLKHTEGGDFRQATYRAVRQGLRKAQSVLLEPWYSFVMELPEGSVGRALNDIGNMGADFAPPVAQEDGMCRIEGSAPVSCMHDYRMEFNSYTHGEGRLLCVSAGYKECKNADEVIKNIAYNCDADTENTADSVFCAHGAGFNVRWDRVEEYMHLESILKPRPSDEPAVTARADYRKREAGEAELISIFESTYGKIKPRTAGAPPRQIHAEAYKYRPRKQTPQGKEYLLIDGYNIIFAWDDLRSVADEDLEAARKLLTDRICNYATVKSAEVILVFDAYKVKNNPGSVEKVNNITVVYTKEAETADAYIERVTHEIGKKHRVRVATSDNLEQMIILGSGGMRIPASEFLGEVQAAEAEIRELIKQNNRR